MSSTTKPAPRYTAEETMDHMLNETLKWAVDYQSRGAIVKAKRLGEKSLALAWFTPKTSDITFDTEEYFRVRPGVTERSLVKDLENAVRRSAFRRGSRSVAKTVLEVGGVLAHEAAHSRWSTWGYQAEEAGLDRLTVSTLMFFEEARVEKRAVDRTRRPNAIKQMLRASTAIVMESLPESYETTASMVHSWGLINGRYRSGIITMKEFGPLNNAARTVLGDDVIDQLVDLQDEAMSIDADRDFDRFVEVAREWNAIIREESTSDDSDAEAEESLEGYPSCQEPSDDSENEEGEGKGEGEESGEGKGEKSESSDSESKEGEGGIGGEGESKDEDEDEDEDSEDKHRGGDVDAPKVDSSKSTATEDSDASAKVDEDDLMADAVKELKEQTKSVEWTKEIITTYPSVQGATETFGKKTRYSGSNWTVREPTSQEIGASNALARHLENLAVPTIAAAPYSTAVPTGRLNTREALRASADRAQGRMTKAKPWVGTKRQHTTASPVIVGIATDTSGSMRWAEQMVASAAFVVGRAGERVNARTAAVTFGSYVDAILNPEEQPTVVRQRAANGGVEEFDRAIAALDGVLNFTTAEGVKILIVVSDNALVNPQEPEKREMWLKRLKAAGVVTIWVDRHNQHVPDSQAAVIRDTRDPMALVKVITKAIDKAFAGRRAA